jgi:hypothetical protein
VEHPQMKHARLVPLALALFLGACSPDANGPAAPPDALLAATPSALVGPNENLAILSDTTDAAGNHVMIAEYAAGTYFPDDTTGKSVASVTIKTVVPRVKDGVVYTSSTMPCITSTVVKTETTPGWTASVKKPGGCDKEIVVLLSNKSTKQSATFSFLYIFGKTRIDFGAVR